MEVKIPVEKNRDFDDNEFIKMERKDAFEYSMKMKEALLAYMKKYHMTFPGDRVIAGLSGGADSVCLLLLLSELREELDIQIRAVHVHHGLRGAEADRDAEFARQLAFRFQVPFTVVYEDVKAYARARGMSEEEAGRTLRYAAFRRELETWRREDLEGKKEDFSRRYLIAVAHQREDQAETILHNLFRGSGLKGLGGMAPVQGDIIRPLLGTGRREILDYLEENRQTYCEDSTNGTLDYTRNKLRNRLLPEICREINSGAVEHILEAGEKMAEADAYFEAEAERLFCRFGRLWPEEAAAFPAEQLRQLPDIIKSYVIRYMIEVIGADKKDISSVHIKEAAALAEKGTGKELFLPHGLRARTEYGTLWLEKEREDHALFEEEAKGKMEENLIFTRFSMEKFADFPEIPQNQYTKWFDYDRIKGTLAVRTRQTGDYITLKNGQRKTVKAFMIDEKIPRQKRDQILLLADGSHILWIIGYRISEYYKVTEDTREILQVQSDGGKEHGR